MLSRIRRKDFLVYAICLMIMNSIFVAIIEYLDNAYYGYEHYNLVIIILLVIESHFFQKLKHQIIVPLLLIHYVIKIILV